MDYSIINRNSYYIRMIYVPRNDRGIGVASLLLTNLIKQAKRNRIHTIYLDNILPPTSKLYQRFGFKYIYPYDNSMVLHVANSPLFNPLK
jgi:GNAT superfamily N-acetyltransferase